MNTYLSICARAPARLMSCRKPCSLTHHHLPCHPMITTDVNHTWIIFGGKEGRDAVRFPSQAPAHDYEARRQGVRVRDLGRGAIRIDRLLACLLACLMDWWIDGLLACLLD